MRFAADRAQLSPAQSSILEGMRIVDGNSSCLIDGSSCQITIVQRDGHDVTYDSRAGDGACDKPRQMVEFASIAPFVATLPCLYAKAGRLPFGAPQTPLLPDGRCWNGVFAGFRNGSAAGTILVPLSVPDPGTTYHLELDQCASPNRRGRIRMQLFAPGASAPLASGADVADPGPDEACQRLEATVPQAGTYDLKVTIDDGFLPAGDFYLRFF